MLPGGGKAVRVVAVEPAQHRGRVFSLEVPGTETFVATAGLVTHNCFPKDVTALKQLAGNSGYHFQLLNSVIEVNELQKRRVLGKLGKHLGSLVGKRIALLGLAFKPDTDDMREASSLVLSARLQGEGAEVVAYDPVAATRRPGCCPPSRWQPRRRRRSRAPTRRSWSPSGASSPSSTGDAMAGLMREPVLVDGRNFLDPATLARGRLHVRGHRARKLIGRSVDPRRDTDTAAGELACRR